MKMKFILGLAVLLFLVTPAGAFANSECCEAVDVAELAISRDDLDYAGLSEAIDASRRFLQKQKGTRIYRFCDREYSAEQLLATLTAFADFSRQELGQAEFERQFAEQFELCAAASAKGDGRVLVTGYFEPLLEGSIGKKPPFIYPLYKKPADLLERDGKVGRLDKDSFSPYWTRAQIENDGVLAGGELVFLDDPVEAFILHVQGSGRIRLRDGRIRRIQFAAKNGLPYRSIGKLLVEQGAMELSAVNLPAITNYLNSHPSELQGILQHNMSFIFFRWGDDGDGAPLGRLGQVLTAGRSVALDHDCFPSGAIGFLKTRKPIFNADNVIVGWAPLRRFVVNQDSGSAIRGGRRVDLFLGAGERARATAGLMKHPGSLYFLVKKK